MSKEGTLFNLEGTKDKLPIVGFIAYEKFEQMMKNGEILSVGWSESLQQLSDSINQIRVAYGKDGNICLFDAQYNPKNNIHFISPPIYKNKEK